MYSKSNQKYGSPAFAIGQVYYMKFHSCENGQYGWRPGIICQNNIGNLYSPNIIAIPLTTVIKRTEMPTHVIINRSKLGLRLSMALCENQHYLSKEDIGEYITTLPDEVMREIAKACLLATALIAYIPADELEEIRNAAVKLNATGGSLNNFLPSAV